MACRRPSEVALEAAVTETLETGKPDLVQKRFEQGLRDSEMDWVIQKLSCYADENLLIELIPGWYPHAFPDSHVRIVLKHTVKRQLWRAVTSVLNRLPPDDEQRRWAVTEAMRHADGEQLGQILLQCCEDQDERALETAVFKRLWRTVCILVRERNICGEKKAWALEEAVHDTDEETLKSIYNSMYCYSEIEERLTTLIMKEAIRKGFLSILTKILDNDDDPRNLDDGEKRKAMVKACKNASDESLKSVYRHNYRDEVLQEAVRRGMWSFIASCKDWEGTATVVLEHALSEACKCPDKSDLPRLVPCLCVGEDKDRLLDFTVSCLPEKRELLLAKALTETTEFDTVNTEEDLEKAPDAVVSEQPVTQQQGITINPLTTEHNSGTQFAEANRVPEIVLRRQSVNLTQPSCSSSDEMKTETLTEASQHAESPIFNCLRNAKDIDFCKFAPYCEWNKLEATLTEAVSRQLWIVVPGLVERALVGLAVPDQDKCKWLVFQAAEHADELCLSVLLHCFCLSKNDLELVLGKVVTRGLWVIIPDILQQGISEQAREAAVEEAVRRADDTKLPSIVLFCTDHQADSVLNELVRRRLWNCVGDVLFIKQNVSNGQRRKAMCTASKYASDDQLLQLLPHCDEDLAASVLEEAITRHLWRCVHELLPRAKSMASWAILEASKHAEEHQFISLVSCCLLSEFSELVNRGQWDRVADMLNKSGQIYSPRVTRVQRKWAVSQASKYAPEDKLRKLIWHRTDDQIDSILTNAVERGMWLCVTDLLSSSNEKQTWAIEELSKRAPSEVISEVYCSRGSWPDGQREAWFTTVVERGSWKAAGVMIRSKKPSDEKLMWCIFEASKRASGQSFVDIARDCYGANPFGRLSTTMLRCSDSFNTSILKNLLARNEWIAVSRLPDCCYSCQDDAEIVRQACDRADEKGLMHVVSARCDRYMVEWVLTVAVKRQFWRAATYMISECRPINANVRDWAIRETMKYAADEVFSSVIERCTPDQLKAAMDEAISRRLWEDLNKLLDRATKHTLPSAVNSQDSQIHWAILESSKCADEGQLIRLFEKHNNDFLVDPVMHVLVRRKLWTAVSYILAKYPVSEEARRMAAEKVMCPLFTVPLNARAGILLNCCDDQLDRAADNLSTYSLWKVIPLLIERGLSEHGLQEVVQRAKHYASDEDILLLLPHCTVSQLEDILTFAVRRRKWKIVITLFANPKLREEKRKETILDLCRIAPGLITDLIPFCSPDMTEDIFSVTMHILQHNTFYKESDITALNDLFKHAEDAQYTVEAAVRQVMDKTAATTCTVGHIVSHAAEHCLWAIPSYLLPYADDGVISEVHRTLTGTRHPFITLRDDQLPTAGRFRRILSSFSSAQLLSTLDTAVRNGQWSRACDILVCIGEHGDPLAETEHRKTVLHMALECQPHRREVIAQCLKLGVGTQQCCSNYVVRESLDLQTDSPNREYLGGVFGRLFHPVTSGATGTDTQLATCEIAAILRMLYESGACITIGMFVLHSDIQKNSPDFYVRQESSELKNCLQVLSSTPRSLKSACRLVISHLLGLGVKRQRNVEQLSIPKQLQEYLLFEHIADERPDAGKN